MKIIEISGNKTINLEYRIQEVYAIHNSDIIRIEIVPVYDIREPKPERPMLWDLLFYIEGE